MNVKDIVSCSLLHLGAGSRWIPLGIDMTSEQIIQAENLHNELLMVVTGYHHKTGECRTKYLHPEPGRKRCYLNDIRYLHDPARFGLQVETTEVQKVKNDEQSIQPGR